jgi:glycosyltransferase involved in cell wall biosynthesis
MSDALATACDAIITTSNHSRNVIMDHFPDIASRLHVIEHGRDLTYEELVVPPSPWAPIRIVCLGNMSVPKGIQLLEGIMALDRAGKQRFEFHFLGSLPKESPDLEALGGVLHGKYKRENLAENLRAIGPSFSIICSIWPETYCHTLTESWAFGLPVFASHIGTLQERVEQHGGGWLLDYRNAERWYREMLAIADNMPGYEQRRAEIRRIPQKTVAEMTAEYLEVYQSVHTTSVPV